MAEQEKNGEEKYSLLGIDTWQGKKVVKMKRIPVTGHWFVRGGDDLDYELDIIDVRANHAAYLRKRAELEKLVLSEEESMKQADTHLSDILDTRKRH